MSALAPLLTVWTPQCVRCGEGRDALLVPTTKGHYCIAHYLAAGNEAPPLLPPTEQDLERVELQWARVKTRGGSKEQASA